MDLPLFTLAHWLTHLQKLASTQPEGGVDPKCLTNGNKLGLRDFYADCLLHLVMHGEVVKLVHLTLV